MSEKEHVTLCYTWLDGDCMMEMCATGNGETHEKAADRAREAIKRNKEAVLTYEQ